jgi:outer membrane protein assembly factor BamB
MKLKLVLSVLILILSASLSACVGGTAAASSWPGLAASADTVYLASTMHVYAVNLANGSEKWRYPAEPDAKISFYAEPAIAADGEIIIGGYNHVLYNLNPNTGQPSWEFNQATNRYIASALVNDQGIFAPNADKFMYALNIDGNLRWKSALGGEGWARPVVDAAHNRLYQSSMDHTLYALNADNGNQLWRTPQLGGAIVGTPALSPQGVLYFGTFGRELVAVDAANGQILWTKPTAGWVWAGPTLVDGRLYFGDLDGNLYAFQAQDGALVWQLKPELLDGPIASSPLVSGETLYVTTEKGSLYAINLEGAVQWSQTIPGKLYAPPVAAGDLILVAPMGGEEQLVAYNQNGARQWAFVAVTKK